MKKTFSFWLTLATLFFANSMNAQDTRIESEAWSVKSEANLFTTDSSRFTFLNDKSVYETTDFLIRNVTYQEKERQQNVFLWKVRLCSVFFCTFG